MQLELDFQALSMFIHMMMRHIGAIEETVRRKVKKYNLNIMEIGTSVKIIGIMISLKQSQD